MDFPLCFLFGPALWLHFKYTKNGSNKFAYVDILHIIPFVLFVVFLLSPLLRLDGDLRIKFAQEYFLDTIMPLNYLRTFHVTIYGLVLLYFILKEKMYKQNVKGIYLTVVVIIYFLTAVLLTYLTRFADSYKQFVVYYFLASTILLVTGFVLFAYPEILQQLHKKYFSSNLNNEVKKRVVTKIEGLKNNQSFFLDSSLNLQSFSKKIKEKPYYVSQVLSEEFKTSFSDFVNKRRIVYSKHLLENPENDHLKILAIAFESGFNNDVTFNKAFVKYIGTTPGKYRKNRPLLSD
ncbi:MAG: helix-turn-helix domain-containing protein [Flavobacteriales bacterium]